MDRQDDVPIDSPNGRISCKLIAVDAGLPKTKPVEGQLKLFKPPNSCKNVSILSADKIVFQKISNLKEANSTVMLEQASYCYLLSIPPMLRKYGFHLVLSGNCYYISNQSFIGVLNLAIKHMLEVLACSHLSLATQNVFLNEFSHVVQSMGMKFEWRGPLSQCSGDMRSGEIAYSFENAHSTRVKGLLVLKNRSKSETSDDSNLIASASSDGMIRVWDARMIAKDKPNHLAEADTKSRLTCLAGSFKKCEFIAMIWLFKDSFTNLKYSRVEIDEVRRDLIRYLANSNGLGAKWKDWVLCDYSRLLVLHIGYCRREQKASVWNSNSRKGRCDLQIPKRSDSAGRFFVSRCSSFTIIGGHVAVFFNYKGKAVSNNVLFGYSALFVFFVIAEIVSTLAFAFLIWTVVTEGLHRSRNVHYDLTTQCPTAKTGMFGGAAFLALDAAILWLVCLTLTLNVRADHFEDEEVKKGEYGQVYATELVSQGA
ncbi:hypothetical protein ZIOFF_058100 [Zingiber officinale]|uniref:Uncharacterized protein n=1 Tax=Zingiber officinale TaxID=94328 RepID=A0A8J5F4E0_ZINOF|nr:hypothetical protein ZIOFF_058100 [Zingiber officinale]